MFGMKTSEFATPKISFDFCAVIAHLEMMFEGQVLNSRGQHGHVNLRGTGHRHLPSAWISLIKYSSPDTLVLWLGLSLGMSMEIRHASDPSSHLAVLLQACLALHDSSKRGASLPAKCKNGTKLRSSEPRQGSATCLARFPSSALPLLK